jgi:protein-tyrosine kinase
VSRFFKHTQKANGGAERAPRENPVLNIEQLLETINQTVDDQLAGIESAPQPAPKVEAVLDAVQEERAPVACNVVEFATERFRQVRIPRLAERGFFPESEVTPAPPALEAYRSLRTRLLRHQAKRDFRTLAISSSTKSEGKTLTIFNLALCCAQLPQFPVLVVDGDLRTRGMSRLFGHDEGLGLADVLSGQAALEAAVLASDIPNLFFIPSGIASKPPTELFYGAPWKEFIAWCKENFKLVLVDCPPVLPLADFDLISAGCESIMLVVRARVTEQEALKRILVQVDSSKLLGVTLNSVALGDHKPYEHYYYGHEKN